MTPSAPPLIERQLQMLHLPFSMPSFTASGRQTSVPARQQKITG